VTSHYVPALNFSPDRSAMTRFLKEPLIDIVSNPSRLHANEALLTLAIEFGIQDGKISAPDSDTLQHLFNSNDRLRCATYTIEATTEFAREVLLVVFRDLSALISVQADAQTGQQVFLPAVFKVARKPTPIFAFEQLEIFPPTGKGKSIRKKWMTIKSTEGQHVPLHGDEALSANPLLTLLIQAVQISLIDTVRSWAASFDTLPYVRRPADGDPLDGTFGESIPAPSHDLSDKPFHWPPTFPWSDAVLSDPKQYTAFLKKALIQLEALNPQLLHAATARVTAGRALGNKFEAPTFMLDCEFKTAIEDEAATLRSLKRQFQNLITGTKAPFDYRQRRGNTIYIKTPRRGSEQRQAAAEELGCARVANFDTSISAHEKIATKLLFEG